MPDRSKDEGFTLIEVLITLFIISMVMLMSAGTYGFLSKASMDAEIEAAAVRQTNSLMERAQSVRWDHLAMSSNEKATRNSSNCRTLLDRLQLPDTYGPEVADLTDSNAISNEIRASFTDQGKKRVADRPFSELYPQVSQNLDLLQCTWVFWENPAQTDLTPESYGNKVIIVATEWETRDDKRQAAMTTVRVPLTNEVQKKL